MSRTTHEIKGKEFPAKTRKKLKDKKFFGFTSGTHSRTEKVYAVKDIDYIKYGYGNGSKQRIKNYKKEI